jgi:hypothetical protein
MKRHVATRTTQARPVKADVYHAIRRDIDEFDIAAIGLHGRPNQVDHILHPLANGLGIFGGRAHQAISFR